MSGNFQNGSDPPAFGSELQQGGKIPNYLDYSSAFVFPPPSPFLMEEDFSPYFSPNLFTPRREVVNRAAAPHTPSVWSGGNEVSSNESVSPTNQRYIAGFDPIDGLAFDHLGDFARDSAYPHPGAAAMPDESPRDVFTPNLTRRPPLSQTRGHTNKIKYTFCVFCKNNGEDEAFYLSHTLKDDFQRVSCPILYNYKCPICGATGPVSHTIRYCPQNGGDKYHEDFASIMVMKQMRSSTGQRGGAPGVIGGPRLSSVPPSKRLPPQALRPSTAPPSLAGNSRGAAANLRGPNAAWTGSTVQPCMVPMLGELVNQQERDRQKAYQKALTELSGYADTFLEN